MFEVLKHSYSPRRMLCSLGVNLDVTRRSVARNVKGRFDRRASHIRATAVKRNTVDKPLIEIEGVQFRSIGKAIERLVRTIFFLLKVSHKRDDGFSIKDTARSEDHKTEVLVEMNIGREFHIPTLAHLNTVRV